MSRLGWRCKGARCKLPAVARERVQQQQTLPPVTCRISCPMFSSPRCRPMSVARASPAWMPRGRRQVRAAADAKRGRRRERCGEAALTDVRVVRPQHQLGGAAPLPAHVLVHCDGCVQKVRVCRGARRAEGGRQTTGGRRVRFDRRRALAVHAACRKQSSMHLQLLASMQPALTAQVPGGLLLEVHVAVVRLGALREAERGTAGRCEATTACGRRSEEAPSTAGAAASTRSLSLAPPTCTTRALH